MSSPGTSKTNRPMSSLSKDYHRSVSEMESNNLLRSTFTDDCHTQKGGQKTCLFRGLRYFWRPRHCRTHLGLVGSTKQKSLGYLGGSPRTSGLPPRCASSCCCLSSRSCVSAMGYGGVTWDSCTISCCNSTSFTRHTLTVCPRK
jgi:hypothetical protein